MAHRDLKPENILCECEDKVSLSHLDRFIGHQVIRGEMNFGNESVLSVNKDSFYDCTLNCSRFPQ